MILPNNRLLQKTITTCVLITRVFNSHTQFTVSYWLSEYVTGSKFDSILKELEEIVIYLILLLMKLYF